MSPDLRATMLAAIFLVGALTVVLQEPAQAQEEEDLQHFRNWSVGDFWRYDKIDAGGSRANTRGEVTYRVQSAERVTNEKFFDMDPSHRPEWKSHQAFRVQVWANQSTNHAYGPAQITTEQTLFQRTADLGHVQSRQKDAYVFTEAPRYNSGREILRETFPPRIDILFPFAVGDAWRTAGNTWESHDRDCGGPGMPPCDTKGPFVYTYHVVGTDRINVKLNGQDRELFTYRIVRVDELGFSSQAPPDARKYEVLWWSPEVCNLVMKEEYNAQRALERTWTLKDYHCKGRDSPDPSYSIYDYQNLSSTRLHGELAVPSKMADLSKLLHERAEARNGGGFLQLGESLPGPAPLLVVAALLVAVAAAGRRRPA